MHARAPRKACELDLDHECEHLVDDGEQLLRRGDVARRDPGLTNSDAI
jgi:hypothetical protein